VNVQLVVMSVAREFQTVGAVQRKHNRRQLLNAVVTVTVTVEVKGQRSRHLYTATYRETRTAANCDLQYIRTGVLTSTNSRRRGAITGRPLPKRTDFGVWTRSSISTDLPMPQSAALWPSPRNVLRQLTVSILVGVY